MSSVIKQKRHRRTKLEMQIARGEVHNIPSLVKFSDNNTENSKESSDDIDYSEEDGNEIQVTPPSKYQRHIAEPLKKLTKNTKETLLKSWAASVKLSEDDFTAEQNNIKNIHKSNIVDFNKDKEILICSGNWTEDGARQMAAMMKKNYGSEIISKSFKDLLFWNFYYQESDV